jgi:hypothetical protein
MTTPTTLRLGACGVASIVLLWKAGPVALLGMFAIGGYLLVRKRTSPPAKAGASVLLPLAVGLTIVAAAVAVLNVALEWSPTSVSAAQLTEIEDFVHTLASRLPSYLKLCFPIQVLVLCGLYLMALGGATWKPVSRFVEGNAWAGRVLASAVIVSSFSVFGHEAGLLQAEADGRIRAVYTASQKRQGESLNRYVAAKAIVETMRRPSARAYLTSLVAEAAGTSMDDEPATHLSAYLGKRLLFGEAAADVSTRRAGPDIAKGMPMESWLASLSNPWVPPAIARPQVDAAVVVPPDANAFISDQKAREDATVTSADAEQRKAIETILTGAADASTSRVKAVATFLVESLIQCQGDFFGDQIVNYLTKALDKSFNALLEPLAAQAANRLQTRIQLALRPGRSTGEAARDSTIAGLTDLTVRVPMDYLRMAQSAAEKNPLGFLDVTSARLYSYKARELLRAFEPSTPDGAVDMRPVSALLERVMPEVTRVLEDDAKRQEFEREVATLRRDVESGARRGGRRAR